MGSNGIAVIAGPRTAFLDHLMPLCDLLQIPLVCTDPWVYSAAECFYPKTELYLAQKATDFQEILAHYRTFYTVEPCRLHPKAFQFGTFLYKGEGVSVAGLHGNTDKFRNTYWVERYADEDILLVYGRQMIDYFQEKGVWGRIKNKVMLGNLRLTYYRKHQDFFNKAAQAHLFKEKKRKTVLWMPTWSFFRSEDDSPFFDVADEVLEKVPEAFQLLIKLHPYTYRLFPEKVAALKKNIAGRAEILLLDEIPLIYPFLNQADIYLGDYSSVGYDFLAMNRPLFFLGKGHGLLAQSGTVVENAPSLYSHFGMEDHLASSRQKLYEYAFEKNVSSDQLAEAIKEAVKR